MRSSIARKSRGTTWTWMPKCARSSCTSVAIFMRCVFDELVTMENSTALPDESSNWPALFQENPADFSSGREASNEGYGGGIAWSTQGLLLEPPVPELAGRL